MAQGMKERNWCGIAVRFYRIERWLYLHHMRIFAQFWFHMMQIVLGCTIPYTVKMGKDVTISHFHAIVLHHGVEIGDGTTLRQNCCIGARNGEWAPKIGKNCDIGAGACILGRINIGDNVNIGANAVVITDLPDNCTAVGVPARVIMHGPEHKETNNG